MSGSTALGGEAFGPYVVYEQLGIGGMASVHRAVVQGVAGFQREVALKRMLPSVAGNADFVKSFVREARLASYLRHANVAQTYELGKVGDVYFIAMELVAGRSLRELLKRCVLARDAMPTAIVLNLAIQLCDALDYAHNLCDETGTPLGIIHRDVSPSNVLVADSGIAKLIDFGIAKASAHGMQTMSGTVKGKFGYMAPEYLVSGQDRRRADLFAVGVLAHELLANQPLFTAKDDMETLMRVRDMRIEPPSRANPEVAADLDDIVLTALERDPDQRWQHASALRNALSTVARRLGMVAHDRDVAAWVGRAFRVCPTDDSDPVISISQGTVPFAMPLGSAQRPAVALGSYPPASEVAPPPPPLPAPLPQGPPSGAQPVAVAAASLTTTAPRQRRAGLVVLFVVLAAAALGAGVYFALPYLT